MHTDEIYQTRLTLLDFISILNSVCLLFFVVVVLGFFYIFFFFLGGGGGGVFFELFCFVLVVVLFFKHFSKFIGLVSLEELWVCTLFSLSVSASLFNQSARHSI